MKIALLFLTLVAFASAEVYTPRSHPVIPTLSLTDGRTLKDAKILSDTAYTVTVATSGKILPIDKILLPPEILAQWPVDEARGASEKARIDAMEKGAAEKLAAKAAKDAAIVAAVKYEHTTKVGLDAADEKKRREQAMARYKASIPEHALFIGGGLIVEGAGSVGGKLFVCVRNDSGRDQNFTCDSLHFNYVGDTASQSFAGIVFRKGQTEDYNVTAGTRRVFLLHQLSDRQVDCINGTCPVWLLYKPRSGFDVRDQGALASKEKSELMAKEHKTPEDEVRIALINASGGYSINVPRR